MKHHVACKLCKKPLTVETSDNYPGDPLKLLPMAVCNACGDRREKIMTVERTIVRCCRMLALQPRMSDTTKARIRETLFVSTRLYSNVIAEAYDADILWGSDFVDILMEQPDKVGIVLSKYRKDVQSHSHQAPSQPATTLPYAD